MNSWENFEQGSLFAKIYSAAENSKDSLEAVYHQFIRDFSFIPWFTYRREFPVLEGESRMYTSDSGWGCMLRSAQMMLAQFILRVHLHGDWVPCNEEQTVKYNQILRLFADCPCDEAPLSLHHMALLGRHVGKAVGEWYGPSTVSLVLQKVMQASSSRRQGELVDGAVVHVCSDSTIYARQVEDLCTAAGTTAWRPLLLLVPVRLGSESFNAVYEAGLVDMLRVPDCLGAIGGKPRHSLYMVGTCGQQVVYLDPHTAQPALNCRHDDHHPDDIQSCSCSSPLLIRPKDLDPSLAFGFFCPSQDHFRLLQHNLRRVNEQHPHALLFVADSLPPPATASADDMLDMDDDDM